jgi:hypothetical protein
MDDIYLTRSGKRKYMDDFINNVLPFNKIDFWKLDEGLADILVRINSSEYIQTIYSKRASFKNSENQILSYLEICYTDNIELHLFREVIPSLFLEINLDTEAKLYYLFDWPRSNQNYSGESKSVGLGCLDDEKYFFINTIKINLESDFKETHSNFWQRLEKTLSQVKP